MENCDGASCYCFRKWDGGFSRVPHGDPGPDNCIGRILGAGRFVECLESLFE